jgi:hypothetical protein
MTSLYHLQVEKDGVRGDWYAIAESAVEAIVQTLGLGVDVIGWDFK